MAHSISQAQVPGHEHDSSEQHDQRADLDRQLADLLSGSRCRRASLLRFLAQHIARQLRAESLQQSECPHVKHNVQP